MCETNGSEHTRVNKLRLSIKRFLKSHTVSANVVTESFTCLALQCSDLRVHGVEVHVEGVALLSQLGAERVDLTGELFHNSLQGVHVVRSLRSVCYRRRHVRRRHRSPDENDCQKRALFEKHVDSHSVASTVDS